MSGSGIGNSFQVRATRFSYMSTFADKMQSVPPDSGIRLAE